MSPRSYFAICVLAAFAALITWLAGAMTPIAVVAVGFLAFSLIFIGMMCVLPSLAHAEHLEHISEAPSGRPGKRAAVADVHLRATLKSA